jgi:hypothetical protein
VGLWILPVAQALIEAGADVDIQFRGSWYRTCRV